jgi:nicotinate-nucleotide pyrophosphorylase (carboxylating)
VDDGQPVHAGDVLGCLRGYWRDLLSLERVFLNLLSHLSGIATMTSRYVDAVRGTGAQVCDSRKTTPGLRSLEKYAVACGGGCLHRIGLHDALMFKDNHLASVPPDAMADLLAAAIDVAREDRPLRFACVEVDDLDQFRSVLEIQENRVDIVLLDNMNPARLREAVSLRNASSSSILLEASGGITLDTIAAVAATGIDRISVGALTHGARWMDIGLDIHVDGNE